MHGLNPQNPQLCAQVLCAHSAGTRAQLGEKPVDCAVDFDSVRGTGCAHPIRVPKPSQAGHYASPLRQHPVSHRGLRRYPASTEFTVAITTDEQEVDKTLTTSHRQPRPRHTTGLPPARGQRSTSRRAAPRPKDHKPGARGRSCRPDAIGKTWYHAPACATDARRDYERWSSGEVQS